MTETTATTEIKPNGLQKAITETVRLGNGFIHINTTEERLRENVTVDAVEAGIPREKAEEFLSQTHYILGGKPSIWKDVVSEIGRVSKNKPNGYTLELNPERLANIIEHPGILNQLGVGYGIKISDSMPQEAMVRAYGQILNAFWVHEKTHLIQKLDPSKTEESKNIRGKISRWVDASSLMVLSGGLAILASEITHSRGSAETLFYIGKYTAMTGLFTFAGTVIYDTKLSPAEKEAYDKQSLAMHRSHNDSPFKIEFERD